MRQDFEHIDKHFSNKLKNHSVHAPEDAWNKISLQIPNAQKKRILFYYKIAASVAVIAVLGSLFFLFNQTNFPSIKKEVTFVEKNKIKNTLQQEEVVKKQKIVQKNEVIAQVLEKEISTSKSISQNKKNPTQEISLYVEEKKYIKEINKQIKSIPIFIKNKQINPKLLNVVDNEREQALDYALDINTLIALNCFEIEKNRENKKNKWLIGGEFSPLYSYRNITGSNKTQEYYNDVETPTMSYTGGLNVQYKAATRLSVQVGVYYTTMGQSIDCISFYTNEAYGMVAEEYRDRFINSYRLNNSMGEINFNTAYIIKDDLAGRVDELSNNKAYIDVKNPAFQNVNAKIKQNFQYIEVPVFMRYKLIDRSFDLNLIGGVGVNFLIGNDVFLMINSGKQVLGETKDINTINYNGTLGIGIEYPLFKRINLRLEPLVKYYLNPINTSSSVKAHPYSFGLYTGINYTF